MGNGRATRRAGARRPRGGRPPDVAQVAAAGDTRPTAFPAAGELMEPAAVIRAKPDPGSKVLRRMTQVRADLQIQVVLALGARRGADGALWYRLSLPGRPNGQRGWVRSDEVDVRPVRESHHRRSRRPDDRGPAHRRREAAAARRRRRRQAAAPRRRSAATSSSSRATCRPIRSSEPSRSRHPPIRG